MSFRSEYFDCVDVDLESNMNGGGRKNTLKTEVCFKKPDVAWLRVILFSEVSDFTLVIQLE